MLKKWRHSFFNGLWMSFAAGATAALCVRADDGILAVAYGACAGGLAGCAVSMFVLAGVQLLEGDA